MIFTTDNFENEVLNSDLPVLVDFYADWCGPCKMLAPSIAALEPEYEGKVKIGKLNVDENPDLAEKYSVMTIPTLLIFKDGKVEDVIRGLVPKSEIQEKLDTIVNR